jgi:hypothetical protein
MNRTPTRRTPIALALVLLVCAGAAQAQSIRNIQDGSSNTLQFADGSVRTLLPVRGAEPAGASLTTRASVSGNISQSNLSTGGFATGNQIASVGGVRNANALAGTIETQGTLTGNVAQTRRSDGAATQELNIGGVAGSLTVAGQARLTGSVLSTVTQSTDEFGGSGAAAQGIDVGGARAFNGNALTTDGTALSALTQTQRGNVDQQLRIASASGNVQDATTFGLAQGTIAQSSTVNSGSLADNRQSVDIGSLQGSQAQSVSTNGVLAGALTQSQSQGSLQAVEIGAVAQVDAAGRITTQGSVSGTVSQQATASANQRLSVGSVRGGSPTEADARGTLAGNLTQTNNAPGRSPQAVLIGSIDDVSGRARTDAIVTGDIAQTLNANATSGNQLLTVGGASGTGGDVTTRAVLSGNVTQNAISAGSRQAINVGSVVGTRANARTDVVVSGNLSQFSNGAGQNQTILLGGVIGAAGETIGNAGGNN